jgi:hypothetical protein
MAEDGLHRGESAALNANILTLKTFRLFPHVNTTFAEIAWTISKRQSRTVNW